MTRTYSPCPSFSIVNFEHVIAGWDVCRKREAHYEFIFQWETLEKV